MHNTSTNKLARRVLFSFIALAVLSVLVIPGAHAQEWPSIPEDLPQLHQLAQKGDKGKIVKTVVQDPQAVEVLDTYGRTALFYASNRAVARALAEAKIDVNKQDKAGLSALMFAAFVGREDVVDELLKLGANPLLTDHYRNTALHFSDNPAVARRLLKAGLRPDARNLGGYVPATTSLYYGGPEVSSLLADVLRQRDGQSDWRLLNPEGTRVLVWPLIHMAKDDDDDGVINGQITEGNKKLREILTGAGFEVVEAPSLELPELTLSARFSIEYRRNPHPIFGEGWTGKIMFSKVDEGSILPVARQVEADVVVVPIILAIHWSRHAIRAVCVSQVSVLDVKAGYWYCNPVEGVFEDKRWMIYPLAKKKNAAAQSLAKALQPFLYLCGGAAK